MSTACSFYSWVPQKHGARKSHGCVKPSFSRILTLTRFAPYALGQAPLPHEPARPHALFRSRSHTKSRHRPRSRVSMICRGRVRLHAHLLFRYSGANCLVRAAYSRITAGCVFTVSVSGELAMQPTVIFVGRGLTHFGEFVSWWVGDVIRRTYKFGGWFTR